MIAAERLVPKELKGLIVFKTFPSTGNLYALVKKRETLQDAEVLQQTTATITEIKFQISGVIFYFQDWCKKLQMNLNLTSHLFVLYSRNTTILTAISK